MSRKDVLETIGIVAIILAVATALAFGVVGIVDTVQSGSNDRFNTWLARCRADGGSVQLFSTNTSGNNDYECFVNGKIIDHEN